LLAGLDITPVVVSLISTIGVLGVGILGYFGIKAQIKGQAHTTRAELSDSEERLSMKVTTVDKTLKNGLHDAMIRMESMIAEVHATQAVTILVDDRPIIRTSAHGGLLWANDAAQMLLGMTLAEMQEDGWAKAVHPQDTEKVFSSWQESVRTRQPYGPVTYRYLNPSNGVITWVKAVAQPIINHELDLLEGWVATIVVIDGPLQGEPHA
jgi:PAS domain S-box-containing protein